MSAADGTTGETTDFGRFEVLTFDCYGTLIDWETGILTALRAVLDAHGVQADGEELLASFARHEAAAEGGPYLPYRQVLARCLHGVCAELGVEPTAAEVARFSESVADWPAFADSAAALARLARRFKLGVITNCDTDLFARSNERLGVAFDWVITAEQLGSYKPNPRNFELARERIGVPAERHLHVAQSLYHDHVPAHALGLSTAWINRRHGRSGSGATPPTIFSPDFEFESMAEFAAALTSPGIG
jgi:2-haloacid dehalogenase